MKVVLQDNQKLLLCNQIKHILEKEVKKIKITDGLISRIFLAISIPL